MGAAQPGDPFAGLPLPSDRGGLGSEELRLVTLQMVQDAVQLVLEERLCSLIQRVTALETQASLTEYEGQTTSDQGSTRFPEKPSGVQPDLSSADAEEAIAAQCVGSHDLSSADVEEAAAAQCIHALGETIWEAGILVGTPAVGGAGSAFIALGVIGNLLIQVVFLFVVYSSFLSHTLPEPDDVWQWREVQGHHSTNFQLSTRKSLVRAVCDGDSTLIAANGQRNLYSSIRNYLHDDDTGVSRGGLLCVVVLVSWSLSIVQEISDLSAFVMAVLHQPRSKRTAIVSSEDGTAFASLSISRIIFVLALTLARFGIAVLLLIFGSIWLANTTGIQDLVLNAAALTFVLDMDEAIYASFVPVPSKILVQSLAPLSRPHPKSWKGVGAGTPAILLCAVSVVLVIIWTHVAPNMKQMKDIEEALCGGYKDFIYDATDLSVVFVTNTSPRVVDTQSFAEKAVREIVETVTDSSNLFRPPTSLRIATYTEFHKLINSENSEVASLVSSQLLGNGCQDYDFMTGAPVIKSTMLYGINPGADVSSCASLSASCASDSRLVRLVCPATCGCGGLHSGLFKNGANQGCPREMCIQSGSYRSNLAQMLCSDYSVSQLKATTGWGRFWNEWLEVWKVQAPREQEDLTNAKSAFLSQGCSALAVVPPRIKSMVCIASTEFGSISPFCPVSCGCADRASTDCPTSCQ